MSRTKILIAIAIFFLTSVVFLVKTSSPPQQEPETSIPTPTPVVDTSIEGFLTTNQAQPDVAEAYRFALENPQDVLSVVKCYCGCLKNSAGHKNNRDCFINEDKSFDLMGLNCGLCVKTALIAKQMLGEGKTVDEIVSYVDARWAPKTPENL